MIEKRCCTCGAIDNTGLINGMCTDCFDMSLDIGKTGKEIDKKKKKNSKGLAKRRVENGYPMCCQ